MRHACHDLEGCFTRTEKLYPNSANVYNFNHIICIFRRITLTFHWFSLGARTCKRVFLWVMLLWRFWREEISISVDHVTSLSMLQRFVFRNRHTLLQLYYHYLYHLHHYHYYHHHHQSSRIYLNMPVDNIECY